MKKKTIDDLMTVSDITKFIVLCATVEQLNNRVQAKDDALIQKKCEEVIDTSTYFAHYDEEEMVIDRKVFDQVMSGITHTMMALGSNNETVRINHAQTAQRLLNQAQDTLRTLEHE